MNAFGFPFVLVAAGFAVAMMLTGVRALRGAAAAELSPPAARRVGIGFIAAGALFFVLSILLGTGAFGPIEQSSHF